MRYLALDPGGTTGWAWIDTDNYEVKQGEIAVDKHEHHRELWDFMMSFHRGNLHGLIVERFNYQRRDLDKGVSLELISREYIGIAKLFCEVHPWIPLHMQQPSAMKLWSDDKLRDLGLYWPGGRHATDATSHLLYFLDGIGDRHFMRKWHALAPQ